MAETDFTQLAGTPARTPALEPYEFIRQHILPLFLAQNTKPAKGRTYKEITTEEQFWKESEHLVLGAAHLKGFRLTDWFPRTPGVYWSPAGYRVRREMKSYPVEKDPQLGIFYSPQTKMGLIERGGIGAIRLIPRKIDAEDCWFATACTGSHCHSGVPVAIPDALRQQSGVEWGEAANIKGRVRFMQDVGLDDIARSISGVRPLILFVEEIEGTLKTSEGQDRTIIAPVVMFTGKERWSAQYSFVQCVDGSDSELDKAGYWFNLYSKKYEGEIITNFDEQRPLLADAPLSYQRLVNKTYDRETIKKFTNPIVVQHLDKLVYEETKIDVREFTMGHKIIQGTGNINVDSNLTNTTQLVGGDQGAPVTREQFDAAIQSLRAELERLKNSNPEEAKVLSGHLDNVESQASKPEDQQKKSLLEFSAKGLKDAAEFVKDIAPTILSTATLISKYLTGGS